VAYPAKEARQGIPERVGARQLYPNEPREVCPVNRLIFIALALLMVPVLAQAAEPRAAEPRIALVIGNSAYPSGPLRNPANDAELMKDTLKRVGFDVIAKRDADQITMKRRAPGCGRSQGGRTVLLRRSRRAAGGPQLPDSDHGQHRA
jgi:hypothetical protein